MKKKILAATLAAAMAFAVQAPAFAATDDPNMTAYETPYTTTVNAGTADTVYLMAVPANSFYVATTFDTEADAAAVEWSVVAGSTAGVSVDEDSIMGLDLGDGTIVSYAEVNVAANATPGAASIEAKNPETGAAMNFTVVVNGTDTAKNNITYKYYNQTDANTNTELLTVSNMTVAGTDYYGNTSYPSVLDGVFKTWQMTQSSDKRLDYPQPTYDSYSNTYYFNTLTFGVKEGDTYNNTTLTAYSEPIEDATTGEVIGYNYYGWQYRVYRNNQVVGVSELIGTDECALQSGDTVIWKFGNYNTVSFPDSLSTIG